MTQAEYNAAKSQKYQEYKAGKITNYAYIQWKKKNDPSLNGGGSTSKQGMTEAEYKVAKSEMYQKYKNGEITNYAYIQWKKKNDPAQNGGSTAKPTPGIASTVGNPGASSTAQAEDKVEKQLKKVYKEAEKDIKAKLKDFQEKFAKKDAEMQKKLADGKISQSDYDAWLKGQVFAGEQWKQKLDQVTGTLLDANQQAMKIINGEKMDVFAENANFQAYQITQDAGMDLSFAIYDQDAVGNLIKNKPELLPRKVVDGKKDKAWNRTKVANAVSQGIIQGESIPDLAARIARDTASENGAAMMRYARTAMTSAQNAGRMETLDRAKGMGIKCKKRWLATLDSRTRDTHQELDGQAVDVDEPFIVDGKEIMYPGDPNADPSLVYNCRCTLIYEYEDYPSDPEFDQRRDNETGEIIQNMSYNEWKAAKENSKLNDLNIAKVDLAQAQKAVTKAKINEDHVFSGIWKDDVTLADYSAKKGSIQAKRDYYDSEISKIKTAQANGESWATEEKLKEKEKLLKELNKFEKQGKLIEARDKALAQVQDIFNQVGLQQTAAAPQVAQAAKSGKNPVGETGGNTGPFSPDAYSQERKDNALWAKSPREADDALRDGTGDVWRNASVDQKDAIFEYTQSYHKFNEPLRGIEYGTNEYKGVGNTDLNARYADNGESLNAMTDIIDKCTYKEDVWLQRGCGFSGMDKFFQVDASLLKSGSQKELEDALLGKSVTEFGFMSCGTSKGKGFDGNILMNIYAPSGTKMMYVEPFSRYGDGDGRRWDGRNKQTSFGSELETILQQGTQFRITKVERRGRSGTIYVDMEVIDQSHQQRWKKK